MANFLSSSAFVIIGFFSAWILSSSYMKIFLNIGCHPSRYGDIMVKLSVEPLGRTVSLFFAKSSRFSKPLSRQSHQKVAQNVSQCTETKRNVETIQWLCLAIRQTWLIQNLNSNKGTVKYNIVLFFCVVVMNMVWNNVGRCKRHEDCNGCCAQQPACFRQKLEEQEQQFLLPNGKQMVLLSNIVDKRVWWPLYLRHRALLPIGYGSSTSDWHTNRNPHLSKGLLVLDTWCTAFPPW